MASATMRARIQSSSGAAGIGSVETYPDHPTSVTEFLCLTTGRVRYFDCRMLSRAAICGSFVELLHRDYKVHEDFVNVEGENVVGFSAAFERQPMGPDGMRQNRAHFCGVE